MSIHYLCAFGAGIETLLEENIVKLDTYVLEEAFLLWIGIVSSTGNHTVLCYSWMSTEWIFCFLSWDSILDSILNSLFLMSLKKHLLYNWNWSCFEHAVACGNLTMLCCVTAAYLKIIEKAACFLSCETRSLTWFSILNLSRNRELRIESRLQWTVNLLLNGVVRFLLGSRHGRNKLYF